MAWNFGAVWSGMLRGNVGRVDETGSCAGSVRIEGSDYTVAGEGQILRGDASRRRQRIERRGVVPTIA